MVLKAPKGVGAVSWEGVCYPVADGLVEVPEAAAPALTDPGYGFTPAPAPQPKTENRKPKTGG